MQIHLLIVTLTPPFLVTHEKARFQWKKNKLTHFTWIWVTHQCMSNYVWFACKRKLTSQGNGFSPVCSCMTKPDFCVKEDKVQRKMISCSWVFINSWISLISVQKTPTNITKNGFSPVHLHFCLNKFDYVKENLQVCNTWQSLIFLQRPTHLTRIWFLARVS